MLKVRLCSALKQHHDNRGASSRVIILSEPNKDTEGLLLSLFALQSTFVVFFSKTKVDLKKHSICSNTQHKGVCGKSIGANRVRNRGDGSWHRLLAKLFDLVVGVQVTNKNEFPKTTQFWALLCSDQTVFDSAS